MHVQVFQSTDNERLVHALLMAFDPFTNEEIKSVLGQKKIVDLTDRNQLKAFYQEPIICILRIKDSVDMWDWLGILLLLKNTWEVRFHRRKN